MQSIIHNSVRGVVGNNKICHHHLENSRHLDMCAANYLYITLGSSHMRMFEHLPLGRTQHMIVKDTSQLQSQAITTQQITFMYETFVRILNEITVGFNC